AQNFSSTQDGLFSEPCQPDFACASLEKRGTESGFKFLDLHRQCWLRDPTSRCCTSKAAMICQRIEIAKLPKRYLCHQNILLSRSIKSIWSDGIDVLEADQRRTSR